MTRVTKTTGGAMLAAMLAGVTAPIAATAQTAPTGTAPVATAPAAAASIQAPVARDTEAGYRLGAGDKLHIIVFGEESLTGDFSVSNGGSIAFPLIGTVEASGHSLADVQEMIRSRLAAGYLKDPRVSVEVMEYRTFYILGEVNKPGQYPYRTNMTVEQAVATAGGYTYRANRKKFVMSHDNDGSETKLQFKDAGGLRIQPGDTIQILERFF
ncbi:polysaccharide biosynthesis/export family protein [Sphingomonas adhaesiva]|uniref:polysaccharide biosynthesis/export family protein n=1 Tax=Sphingomonas adhaesiva TaxID=28212 RepID=UPI002FFB69DD